VREVTVAGIRMVEATNDIVLLLAEANRQLPIWIGSPEAAAIAFSQQGVVASRPLTHDLICNILRELDLPCVRVEVIDLVDGVFFAELVLSSGKRISCRPSDGVAVALRAGVPIFVADAVLDAAAIVEETSTESEAVDTELDVDAFRAFLDEVSPDDFGAS
jgi:bifunctional DNase/RNase